MFVKLEAPILYASDVKESVRFYVEHFGFSVCEDGGDFVMLSLGETRIALNKGGTSDKVAGHQTIMLVSDAIEEDYEAMNSAGVKVESPLHDPGYGKTFMLRDPDGNKIEIVE